MSDQLLSADPAAGAPPPPPAAPSTGYWEDRGIAGKVWHPGDGGNDRTRVDNSLLGLPPELAATSALGIGRAIAAPAANLAGRALAGAKGVITEATPIVKYELTKTTLEKMGVPTPIAMLAAMGVSGYRGNGKHAPAESTPVSAEPVSPAAATPVAPAPPSAPAGRTADQSPPSGSPPSPAAAALPDQKALNEAALAARRAAYQASLAKPVTAEAPATDVMQRLSPATAAAVKPHLSAEAPVYLRLLKAGKSPADAMQAIQAQREFAARFGLPSPTDVRGAVADRNATGRWPE